MLPSIHGSPDPDGPDDRTRFVPRIDDSDSERTTLVPQVRRPSRVRTLLPWVGFGLVAVVVVAATTAWASTLRSPDDPALTDAAAPVATVSQLPVSQRPVPSATAAPGATSVAPVRTAQPRSRATDDARPAVPSPPVVPPVRGAAKPTSAEATSAATKAATKTNESLLYGSRTTDAPSGSSPTADQPTARSVG